MRWALLLLFGCEEPKLDTGSVPIPPWQTDDDGDGYTADEDCDDIDAGIFPGATERCDGLDQDCDELVDEDAVDAPAWYADEDEDGHGDLYGFRRVCDPIPGWLETGGDCDDADASVFPGAPESCDGDDDDCDGEIDEGNPADSPTWYLDADGDGYGGANPSLVSCPQPEGYVAEGTDCDDTTRTIHPGAPESCDRGDEDCDGEEDEDPVDGAPWYADADDDGWGTGASLGTFCAWNAPDDSVPGDGDCDDANELVNPGIVETCDGVDQDCDGVVDGDARDALTWYADADGDGWGDESVVMHACELPAGYTARGNDCDDTNAAISPVIDEHCDGVDEDCNGRVDDRAVDATTWYADADSDGYGDPTDDHDACDKPPGYVADATDCDDAADTVYPGAPEYCDATDTDCDGTLDEDDALDAVPWYADADSDGFGDAARTYAACALPAGFSADATDCDDSLATVHPGAPEYCDATDTDCDGTLDEDDAVDAPSWYADLDGDGYGDAATAYASCTAPADHVAASTDCDDADPFAAPGRPEVCDDGADNDCDGTSNGCVRTGTYDLDSVYHARVTGGIGSLVGSSVAFAGDVDGDGIEDLLVGASGESEAWLYAGVPYGDLTAFDTAASFGGDDMDAWGVAVAGLGDWDGDGLGDAVVGGNGRDGGAAVLLGPWTADRREADADFVLTQAGLDDLLGDELARVGDLDGDGLDDLVVGARAADFGGTNAGAVYVVYGGVTGTFDASLADGTLYGATASAGLGISVAGLGDVDGDGLVDLLMGASGDNTAGLRAGAAHLVLGPAGGALTTGDALATFLGESALDAAGFAVSSAGDLDSDGTVELVVGAPYRDDGVTGDAGAVYLLRGPFAGVTSLSAAAAVVAGANVSDTAGTAVAGVGDFNADGFDDVAVGVPYDDTVGLSGGLVAILYGPDPWPADLGAADLTLLGGTSLGFAGRALAGGHDVTGDGVSDLLVGAPGDSTAGASAGRASIIPGRGI